MMSKRNGVGFEDVGGKRLLCEREQRIVWLWRYGYFVKSSNLLILIDCQQLLFNDTVQGVEH